MADVFVSYSRRNSAFVRGLHEFLTGEGREVWVDWEDIPPASKWEQGIDDSIDDSDSFLFVASPDSLASEYCSAELSHAVDRGKRIVPLAIDGANPDEAPEALRQLNWIWCRETDDRDAALAKLTSALNTDLEWAQTHTRLLKRAVEWDKRGDGSLLMRGKDLAEAERDLAANAGSDPRPTELQERYLHASRRSAKRRQRALLSGVTVAFAVAAVLAVLAVLQRNTAIRQRDTARSLVLSTAADVLRARHLDLAMLLGVEANRLKANAQTRSGMISSLEALQNTAATAILRTDSPVDSVAFSQDGRMLAAGEQNGDIRIWDLRTHREVPGSPLPGQGSAVTSVAFNRDGTMLAAGDKNLRVRLWNLRKRRQMGDPLVMHDGSEGSNNGMTAVSFSPGGRRVAGADAAKAMLWDVATGKRHGPPLLLGRADFALQSSFSPRGQTLARLGDGIELWNVSYDDIASSTKLPDNKIDTGAVSAKNPNGGAQYVAVSRDGRTVAGSNGSTVQLWSVRTPHAQGVVQPGHAGNIQAIAISPDGGTVASGGDDDTVRLSDVPARTAGPKVPPGVDGTIMTVAVTPTGRLLTGGGVSNATRVWVSGGPRPSKVRVGGVAHLVFSPDGKLGAVTSNSRNIAEVWTVATGDPASPSLTAEANSAAAFDPAGTHIVTGGDSGKAWVWRVGSRERPLLLDGRSEHDGAIQSVAFSPEGKFVVTGAQHGRARLWNAATGKSAGLFDAHKGAVESVAFSADGKQLATGGDDGTARIWTVSDRGQVGEPLRVAPTGYGVNSVSFSPDGRTLATGTDRGQVQLWDVASHQPLGRALAGDLASFSPDGRSLFVAGAVAQQRALPPRLWTRILWRNASDLRSLVCSVAWTNLTKAEWATYAPGLPTHTTCG